MLWEISGSKLDLDSIYEKSIFLIFEKLYRKTNKKLEKKIEKLMKQWLLVKRIDFFIVIKKDLQFSWDTNNGNY